MSVFLGIVIGENLAAGYEKWSHVLTSWMSERKYFIYKSNSPTDNLQAGHYTQVKIKIINITAFKNLK